MSPAAAMCVPASTALVEEMHAISWQLRQLRSRLMMGQVDGLLLADAHELTIKLEEEAKRSRELATEIARLLEQQEARPTGALCCGGRGPRARRDGHRWDSAALDEPCPSCGARAVIVGAPSDVLAAFDAARGL